MILRLLLYAFGISIFVLGMARIRAHPKGASLHKRVLNVGTFWSILYIAVGVAVVSYALGYVGSGR